MAESGATRPCSQSCNRRRLTWKRAENSFCESPSFSRASRTRRPNSPRANSAGVAGGLSGSLRAFASTSCADRLSSRSTASRERPGVFVGSSVLRTTVIEFFLGGVGAARGDQPNELAAHRVNDSEDAMADPPDGLEPLLSVIRSHSRIFPRQIVKPTPLILRRRE